MPRLNIDLTAIGKARNQAASLTRQLNTQARQIADTNASITAARKAGDATRLAELTQTLAGQTRQRDGLADQRAKAGAALKALLDKLARARDPSLMVESLDGGLPVAMLPVRLETRYLNGDTQLGIRIYPDAIHAVSESAGLTAMERARGEAYWNARFGVGQDDAAGADDAAGTSEGTGPGAGAQAGADARAAALWRLMVRVQGAPRSTWVVRMLAPTNLADLGTPGAAPVFPAVDDITPGARATAATALPDRWCAVGVLGGREVFRVWSGGVPDRLPMAPVLDPNLPMPPDEDIFGGERAWLVDFQAALSVGMGLVVNKTDLKGIGDFSKGLDRLVVLGVDWTLDGEGSAGVLGGVLQAHEAQAGLAFVPLGQPTNNTGRAASGYSSGTDTPAAPIVAATPAAGKYAAAERLCDALGLATDAIDAPNIAGADLDEASTSMHMINALWRGTLGRYMADMFNGAFPIGDPGARQPHDLVTDAAVTAARTFAVQYLRPAGPLPAFRIGKQPYGVLPVVAPAAYRADASIDEGVRKVVADLRSRWTLASSRVPRMLDGKLQTATELLQTGPWSRVMRARGVNQVGLSYVGPSFSVPGEDNQMAANNQQFIKRRWSAELLGLFGIAKPTVDYTELDNVIVATESTAMTGVPWVEPDPRHPTQDKAPQEALNADAQGRNYIGAIRDALGLGKGQAKPALSALQGSGSLLQMLLAYSAEEEIDRATLNVVVAADQVTTGKTYGRTLVSNGPVTSVGIEPIVQTATYREITTPKQVALLRIPAITGSDTVQDYVVKTVGAAPVAAISGAAATAASIFVDPARIPLPFFLADVARLRESLAYLAGKKVGELDIALKTTLDAYSYRLDAWYTALAYRRLRSVRETRPTGVYLGGYAWLENLPGTAAKRGASLGYVHAPSVNQAQAAAILRSGHLANRDDAADSFNIDLSSARARRAMRILQGVGNGQALAALLGYTLERSLRDALLGYVILPLRLAFPLKATDDPTLAQPDEHVGARDVVDAIKLLDLYDAGGASAVLAAAVAAFGPLVPNLAAAKLDVYLKDLKQTWDAVSDVLVSEGVYQVARGNLERAGAALAVLDKQSRPIDPQITRTPRNGVSYAQRVAVMCRADALPDAWREVSAADPRAAAEPRLNAWLGTMLGDPARFAFDARVMRGDTLDAEVLRVTPAQLGWSPLTLVLACQTTAAAGQGVHTPLRTRIAQALTTQVPDADADTQLIIQAQPDAGGAAGNGGGAGAGLGLAAFEALAANLARLVNGSRALLRRDVIVPDDAIDSAQDNDDTALGEYVGCDLADLEARAAAAVNALQGYLAGLAGASAGAQLVAALYDGWTYGLVAALSPTSPALAGEPVQDGESATGLEARRQQALTQGKAQLAAAAALAPGAAAGGGSGDGGSTGGSGAGDSGNGGAATPPAPVQRIQNAIARIKAVFGKDFPVLPGFTLGAYAADIARSLAARSSMTQGDSGACAGWLSKLGRVRTGAERLGSAMVTHEALLGPRALADWQVVQLPYSEGDCWAALPARWANPAADPDAPRRGAPTLAWVAHAPGGFGALDAQSALSGLLVDEWQEFVPSAWQTTGIGFHYDAPGSRPPQSILLAVPPAVNLEQWTFANLLATVNEALDLAKLRAVRPQDLSDGLGLMLPANYLPDNPGSDTPSVRLSQLIKYSATLYGNTTLPLGKQ